MMFSCPAGWEPAPEVLPARDTIYHTERNMIRGRETRVNNPVRVQLPSNLKETLTLAR